MDSVGMGRRGDVMRIALIVRGRNAVAVACDLCAEASENIDEAIRIVRTARALRGRSAVERAGELCAEANNLRLMAETIVGSLNTSQELDTAAASPR